MAQFNIDIPGVGTITVDGNFATEDSINRLASSMRRGNVNDPFPDLRDGIDDTTDSLNLFDPAIRKNKKSVDDNTKSLNRFNDGFSRVDGMFSDLGDPGSGSLTKLVKTVGEAGAGLGKGILEMVPVIGDGLSTLFTGALGALTGIATEAIGFAQGLIQINKDINNAGLGMVNGLQDMESAAAAAGVPFQQFSKALLENVDSIRLMTGGVQSGVGLISKSLKRLDRDGMQMLYSMGFTVEDIIGTMSDLAATATMTGKTLSDAELADATDKYLRNQQELARITGISVKEQKSQLEASRRSVFIQAQLQGLTNEQRIATQGFLNVLQDPGLQEFALKGFTTDRDTMALMQLLPAFDAALQEVTQGVKSGALTQEEAIARYKELMSDPEIANQLAQAQRTLGVTIEGSMGNAAGITALLGQIQTQLTQQATQSGAEEAVDYQKRTLEGMNKSVAAMEQLMLDVNSGLSTLGFTLFSFVDGYLGSAADATGNVVDRFQEISNTLKEYNLAREALNQAKERGDTELIRDLQLKEREAKDKLSNLTGQVVGNTSDALTNFTTQALDVIRQMTPAIVSAIAEGFANISWENIYNKMMGQDPVIAAREEEASTMAKLGASMLDLPALITNNLANSVFGTNISPTPFYDYFIRRPSSEELSNNSNSPSATSPSIVVEDPNQPVLPPTPQALGGIFDYKPGGEIVRVAEASDEIVAPAKRGADGKLGLEVTGVMLDNSRLLQNLLKVNEGQASLIASLNSQMASMNGNFEKLVYEQRQANRLAV